MFVLSLSELPSKSGNRNLFVRIGGYKLTPKLLDEENCVRFSLIALNSAMISPYYFSS